MWEEGPKFVKDLGSSSLSNPMYGAAIMEMRIRGALLQHS